MCEERLVTRALGDALARAGTLPTRIGLLVGSHAGTGLLIEESCSFASRNVYAAYERCGLRTGNFEIWGLGRTGWIRGIGLCLWCDYAF
jgi:hypothetical protein